MIQNNNNNNLKSPQVDFVLIVLQSGIVQFLFCETDSPDEENVPFLCSLELFGICCIPKPTATDIFQRAEVLQPSGFLWLLNFWILECAQTPHQAPKWHRGWSTLLSEDSGRFSISSSNHPCILQRQSAQSNHRGSQNPLQDKALFFRFAAVQNLGCMEAVSLIGI